MKRKRKSSKSRGNLNPETGNPFGKAEKVINDVKMPKTPSGFGNGGFGDAFSMDVKNPFSKESGLGSGGFSNLGNEKSIGKRAKKDITKFNKNKKPFDFFGGMRMDD